MKNRSYSSYRNSEMARVAPKKRIFRSLINSKLKRHRTDTGLVEDRTNSTTVVRMIVGLLLIHLIVIGGVILVAAIVLGIKFREQIGKTLVVYKSEFKKVSWLSWKDTKKSSWIVLGVLVACAIVICLLDLGLFEGFMAMINAFGKLFAA